MFSSTSRTHTHHPRGAILVVVLVLLATGLTIGSAIIGLAFSTTQRGGRAVARVAALHLAESGIHYERWRLAHNPNDATDAPGDRVLALRDATGRAAGTVTVAVGPPDVCTGRIRITSTAAPAAFPTSTRSINVTYARPSLAQYAYLTNTTLYFGGGGSVDGRIHANSGIRMDSGQNALATSAVATYTCGAGHGCETSGESRPGVWGAGTGGTQGLWRFPFTPVPFAAITADLKTLRDNAAANGGVVLPPSGAYGYYLKFKSNGTVDIHRVTNLRRPIWSHDGTRWIYESHDLSGVPTIQRTHTLPQETCGLGNLIVVEDNVWVDGIVKGRATVVARFPPEQTTRLARIYLNGSLTLQDPQQHAIGIIAQEDIRFPLVLPDVVNVAGVLIAQQGRIFRPYYPDTYQPWHVRPELHLSGSLITNGVAVTAWIDRDGNVLSGFQSGTNTFDARYTLNPPPYIPALSEPTFMEWSER
ncbi:MAG: hypothetical protein Q7R80_04930 [bacterium]|nr:hypothetical protein [bacterium]